MKILTDDDLKFVGTQESQFISKPSEFKDEVLERFNGNFKYEGDRLPWSKTQNCVALRPCEVSIWSGYNGHGKALCLDTPIYTPDGFKELKDIHAGDIVFDENGEQCNVVAETQVQIGRPCYEVEFSDGSTIVADAEHEWLTWTAKARSSNRTAIRNNRVKKRELKKSGTDQTNKRSFPKIVTTKEIAATYLIDSGGFTGKNEHSVPVAGRLNLKNKKLPIDPYILGAWLGDGNSADAGMTSDDIEIINYFSDAGYNVTKRSGTYQYGICGGFLTDIRNENLLNNKHIPAEYLTSSYKQRLALVQGLMDTDGYITDYGRCEFTSIKIHIAEDMLQLVLSLGLQAKMITGDATLNGRIISKKYRVTFTPDIPVFRLIRKLAKIKKEISFRVKQRYIVSCNKIKSVPVKCIQVDSKSHLYLAGKNLIPTHNSQILGQIIAWTLNKKWLVASMEMKPSATIQRMLRQVSGTREPADNYINQFLNWTDDKLWIYDQQDSVSNDRILGMIHYAARELGIDHIVIDSLMKCGIATDDYASQKTFVDKLCWAAKTYNIHIHLVHHMRKGADEMSMPGKHDLKGSGDISDLVDNVFIVHRNKSKERKIQKGDDVNEAEPDCKLGIVKQRHGEWEGVFNLWFHKESMQYIPDSHNRPMMFNLMN